MTYRVATCFKVLAATWPTALWVMCVFFCVEDENYIYHLTNLALLTEIPEIVKIATTLIPALRTLPLLGKIIPLLSAGDMNDALAQEKMERDFNNNKDQRTKTKTKGNKHVIKISDALECVESGVFDSGLMLALVKGLVSAITGGSKFAPDVLFDQIAQCMLEKKLQQDNKRKKGKFVSEKGLPEEYSEIISLRKGQLHPFLPDQ